MTSLSKSTWKRNILATVSKKLIKETLYVQDIIGNLIYRSKLHTITRRRQDMNFVFEWWKQYFTNVHSEWEKYIYIFKLLCNFIDKLIVCTKQSWNFGKWRHQHLYSEDIENMPSGSRMFQMHFTSVLFTFKLNTRIDKINFISTISWSYLSKPAKTTGQ